MDYHITLSDTKLRNGVMKFKEGTVKLSGKILDMGCGDSPYHNDLGSDDVVGIDLPDDLRLKSTWSRFKDNEFDCVISFGVLHWLGNKNWLQESYRVLKDGGLFHHYFWERTQIEKPEIRLSMSGMPTPYKRSQQEAYDEFTKVGFKVEQCINVNPKIIGANPMFRFLKINSLKSIFEKQPKIHFLRIWGTK